MAKYKKNYTSKVSESKIAHFQRIIKLTRERDIMLKEDTMTTRYRITRIYNAIAA